jgi:SpoIID/LytB domain protein
LVVVPGRPVAAETTFTFEGGGFGHSVGMSQYGAYGMALEGYSWQQIITHYFTGASVAEADRSFTRDPIWVNLVQERGRIDLTPIATGNGPAAPVTVTRGDKSLTAGEGETITVSHLGDGRCQVSTGGDSFQGNCSIDLEWDGWVHNPTTAIRLGDCSHPDWNNGGTKPCRYAYGGLRIRPDNNTQTFNVSVEIDIEDYLLGLNESPYSWGSAGGMEALRAQAVAARSYALHRTIERGDPAGRPWCWCHVYDTTIDQFYVGWGHLRPEWTEAVTSTAGMVATHPSETRNGKLIPIETFYSSSTFGATENSEDGFITFVPYLRSVPDPWSLMPETGNPYGRWTTSFTGSQLAARLPGMSSVTDLAITECSATGAALEITFYGNGGPRAFKTRDLRGQLGLLSMQITNAGSPLPNRPPCGAADGSPQPEETESTTTVPDQPDPQSGNTDPGPAILVGLVVDDDNNGDSAGNADGTAQCGETVELTTVVRNVGADLTGVGATARSEDPYATVLWNEASALPDLISGSEAGNEDDWDVAIAPNTPDGHRARLTVVVEAAEGGPWSLDVTVQVSCARIDAVAAAGTMDLNRNGTPDVVTAYRDAAGRPHLAVRDGNGSQILAPTPIAQTGYEVVDLEVMPNGSEAAVLLHNPTNHKVRIVLVDLRTGQKTATIKGGARHEVFGLAILPGVTNGATGLAVLERNKAGGKMRVAVRRADTGGTIRTIGVGFEAVDLAALGNVGRTTAPDLAVLGRKASGTVIAVVADPRSGKRVSTIKFADAMQPTDLAIQLDGSGGPGDRLIAVGVTAAGEIRIATADVRTKLVVRTADLPLGSPIDAVALPDVGGSATPDLAVLGLADDGTVTAIVIDPGNGHIIAGPELPADLEPRDLAVIRGLGASGVALASLGISPAGEGTITLRDAASGRDLGSLAVP